ncbi:MAG: response regulator [Hylemonella sp.]|nr:response regulator [Hylemonella sp.]
MSIFDRFWGTAKRTATPVAVPGHGVPGELATTGVGTGERRNRKRKNARQGAKALIIDDSATVVAALRRILRSAGYATREAMDAEQGLLMIEQEQPDLIFLDIILPGMNGFGALRVIRKDPVTQHIPVIMISGNEHATEQFYANRIGADDFMKKPFSRFEVFARIESLLDANRVPQRKGEAATEPAPRDVSIAGSVAPAPVARVIEASVVRPAPVVTPGLPALVAGAQGQRRWSALDARKELTAMGLQYFDPVQLFAAIRRGDQLAVELFMASGGVAVDEPLEGKTALALATELGKTDIARLFQGQHAQADAT